MEPGRPARHDLQRLRRRAGGGQHGERVGLGVERVDLAGCPTSAGRRRSAFASARRTPVAAVNWSSGLSPLKICPTSNSATSAKPRSALRLRRRDEARQQARPHVGEVGRDRIGERQLRLAAAEQLGLRLAR